MFRIILYSVSQIACKRKLQHEHFIDETNTVLYEVIFTTAR